MVLFNFHMLVNFLKSCIDDSEFIDLFIERLTRIYLSFFFKLFILIYYPFNKCYIKVIIFIILIFVDI